MHVLNLRAQNAQNIMTSTRMHRYSCEPSRSSAYSDDIRWRIVWQKEIMKLSDKEVAANLCIVRQNIFHQTTF